MEPTRNDLPEQIIMDEILVRLPAKSLCRFKSVSKLWYAEISSTEFAKSHLKRLSNSNSKRVFFEYDGNSGVLDYEAEDDEVENPVVGDHVDPIKIFSLGKMQDANLDGLVEADILGSSCGLVCRLAQQGQIYLCNPILRHCRMISTPEIFYVKDIILRGFGYVSSIDDFKIVLGLRGQSSYPIFYVFSLKHNDWRKIEGGDHFNFIATFKVDNCNGILVDESLHWWTTPTGTNNNGRILSFDLSHEFFDEIPIPELLSFKVSYMFNSLKTSGLSTMGRCLCLSVLWEDHNVEIWTLKEYGDNDSWVRLYDLRFMPYYKYHCANFFGFTKTGKFVISCSNKSRYNFFFLVDPNHPYYPKFNPIGHFWGETNAVVDFVGSLVSPFGLETPIP